MPKVSGEIRKLNVDIGSRVRAGEVLAEVDAELLVVQARQAEAALAAAQAKLTSMEVGPRSEQVAQAEVNLDAAQQKLAAMMKGPRAEQVAQAQANVRVAESRLRQLKDGPTKDQIAAAEAQVRLARNQLFAVQTQADALLNSQSPQAQMAVYTHEMKQAQSGVAYEQVQVAEANLAQLKAGPTAEQLTQAQAAVDVAREQLKLAQNPFTEQDIAQAEGAVKVAELQLKLVRSPYAKQDLDAVRAQVAQAQATVDLARYHVDQARIVAPINGVIADRFLQQGGLAAPSSPIVSLVSDEVEVTFGIDERQIGQVSAGMPVAVTLTAFPGEVFPATVSSISPTLDPRTRTFTAKVLANNSKLRPGMFAQVKITAEKRAGVTLVPKQAVTQRVGKAVVVAAVEGRATVLEVDTGLSDEQFVEVLRGVEPGAQVVVSGGADLLDGDTVRIVATQ